MTTREERDRSVIAAVPDRARRLADGTFSATDVPSAADASALLRDGVSAEEVGELGRALDSFGKAARSDDPAIAAEAFTRLSDVYRSRAAWDEALGAARQAQRLAQVAGDDQLLAHALIAEGNVFMCRGDFAEATTRFEHVLGSTADLRMRGLALQNVGSCLAQRGQLGAAERAFSESYGSFQRAGYRRGEATALNNLGRAALDRGDAAFAENVLTEAITAARDAGHGELIALAMLNLSEAKARRGEIVQAHEFASVALGSFTESGNRWREIECLRLIGAIHEQGRDFASAEACFERGLRLAREIGAAVEVRTLEECVARIHGPR